MSAHPVITPFSPSQVPPCLAAVLRISATLLPWSTTSSQPLLNCRILSCFRGPQFGEDTIRPAAIFSAFPMVPSNLCDGCGLCMRAECFNQASREHETGQESARVGSINVYLTCILTSGFCNKENRTGFARGWHISVPCVRPRALARFNGLKCNFRWQLLEGKNRTPLQPACFEGVLPEDIPVQLVKEALCSHVTHWDAASDPRPSFTFVWERLS